MSEIEIDFKNPLRVSFYSNDLKVNFRWTSF